MNAIQDDSTRAMRFPLPLRLGVTFNEIRRILVHSSRPLCQLKFTATLNIDFLQSSSLMAGSAGYRSALKKNFVFDILEWISKLKGGGN